VWVSNQWTALYRVIVSQRENALFGYQIFGFELAPSMLVRVFYLLGFVSYFMFNYKGGMKITS
jgi:hypothetical protein